MPETRNILTNALSYDLHLFLSFCTKLPNYRKHSYNDATIKFFIFPKFLSRYLSIGTSFLLIYSDQIGLLTYSGRQILILKQLWTQYNVTFLFSKISRDLYLYNSLALLKYNRFHLLFSTNNVYFQRVRFDRIPNIRLVYDWQFDLFP